MQQRDLYRGQRVKSKQDSIYGTVMDDFPTKQMFRVYMDKGKKVRKFLPEELEPKE